MKSFKTFLAIAVALSLSTVVPASAAPAKNVVLVHGLFADGSCWSEVIARLQAAGLNVTSVQNPLTTLDDAVAQTQRVLARQDGPTVLVGHSFAGVIVTQAGVDPKVSAVVYVAARGPAHNTTAIADCCNDVGTPTSRYTLGRTRSHRPVETRRVIAPSDRPTEAA